MKSYAELYSIWSSYYLDLVALSGKPLMLQPFLLLEANRKVIAAYL